MVRILNPTISGIYDKSERGQVLSESWVRFQAANLPAMLSTLLGWRPGSVRSGTTPAPQPPPGAVVALRLPKVFRDVSAAQLTATIVVFALLEIAGRQPRSVHSSAMH